MGDQNLTKGKVYFFGSTITGNQPRLLKNMTPRSYLIRTQKGRILRRNLKQCKNPFQLSSYDEFGPERVAVGGNDITIPDSEERERHSQDTVTVMESRFPAIQVLWLGRGFYKVKHGVTSATLVARMTLATNLATILATLATNRLFSKMQPFSRYFY
ncbi:hypothetical protein AVEN_189845-1 [Araneus ventricosus]|uniref:Uncharacterized protein n=1 Tax=Araneus ventricosus TaxID=182803 RepID=A0A4Y2EGR0_ARAVE|nr:hypothetical protein AVEN_189845-1 [Araneus ventricosus]